MTNELNLAGLKTELSNKMYEMARKSKSLRDKRYFMAAGWEMAQSAQLDEDLSGIDALRRLSDLVTRAYAELQGAEERAWLRGFLQALTTGKI